ncbi:exodeoxyribonuclease I [Candidatus Saccharibacteria bacterium CPR2]|nr:exodeoxyribonuclease I [Candidatus Saccharibacteria bacterium CPR2]
MSFYFYDLETSGRDPRSQRIMQFAGQRTNDDFEPVGEPLVEYIALSDEVLPDPEAVLITGITPQKTQELGYSEAEFLKLFYKHAAKPNTIFLGYNTIRFDDEFMRFALYRNFYDPYEWQWKDGCSKWDILDVVRMARALRPEGIKWPVTDEGKPSNKLEAITDANSITHKAKHDAHSDVLGTIAVARMLKEKQPKLFNFLLEHRQKDKISKVVSLSDPKPFVHTSGKLSGEFLSTSIFVPIAAHPTNSSAILVYDLRYDPTPFKNLSSEELADRIFLSREELDKSDIERLPVKSIHVNRAPAVAPLGVLDQNAQQRIQLTIEDAAKNLKKLAQIKNFAALIHGAFSIEREYEESDDVDTMLYQGFFDDHDKKLITKVRGLDANSLADYNPEFHDGRLDSLLLRYKARNYPNSLSESERSLWEVYKQKRLIEGALGALSLESFLGKLNELSVTVSGDTDKEFLLEELALYAQSIAPTDG